MSATAPERRKRQRRGAQQVAPAIHWHEGMLLAPQHFQLASRRAEELLHYHVLAISPFHWGLIEFARTPLTEDVITVTKVEAVMPDGLLVMQAAEDAANLAIDLKKAEYRAAIEQGPQTVFLTIAARNPGERFEKRYGFADEHIQDENSAGGELEVAVLRPRLELTLTDSLPESSVGFPIARVEMRGSGIVEQKYEPPWLQVRKGSAIHTLCNELAVWMRGTAVSLEASIRHSSKSLHGVELLETRMLIHGLVSPLLAVEALLDSNVAHPFSLYVALASAIGNLPSRRVPARLPAYDHDHLLDVFGAVKKTAEEIKRTAIHAPYELHPFVAKDRSFRLQIEPSWVHHKLMIGVAAPEGAKPTDVDRWVIESTIAEAGELAHLLSVRATGVERKRVDGDVLPGASGVAFYELGKLKNDFAVASRELVIKNVNAGGPEEIVLYVNTET
jgi:type VI secretion system protein ImpJ